MRLLNTLSRKKEDFVPVQAGRASIYVCGPTTYNFIHAGNARPYVVFDVLRRFLEHRGFDVTYVQNFTDIDDKIIQKANEENLSYCEISARYIREFFVDIEGLNVLTAHHYPRVTEEIDGIVELVQDLIKKGFAYETQGTVYFISHMAKDYGKLSKKNIDDLEAGARVQTNPDKRNLSDFVLWKAAKSGEPSWDSPWGLGRPGWHIECSVMAKKFIGETIDIHCGGEDLMFPHHENEIAQSEAAADAPFVNYWLHNGMLLVDGAKMAKSADNFFLVREIAQKYSYAVLRFFLLSVHYRSPLNFSEELIQASANGLERIRNCRRELAETDIGQAAKERPYTQAFEAAPADDLNTANAVAVIFDLVKAANMALRQGDADAGFLNDLDFMCGILGIKLEEGSKVDDAEIEKLIALRNTAKADKNFALSDEIRDKLAEMGVTIKDTREGTKWHLTSN